MDNLTIRPQKLTEYIGQDEIKELLSIYIKAAKMREEALEHILFYGPPGLGKTTIAEIIANELGVNFKITSGATIEKSSDLISILTSLSAGDVLFIDEIHRLPKSIEEILYSAMEDYAIDIIINRNNDAKSVRIDLVPFTLVAATTKIGELSAPLRTRFGVNFRINYYKNNEIKDIIKRTALIYDVKIDDLCAMEIAKRARQTPRIANKLFLRIRDFAQVLNNKTVSLEVVEKAFRLLHINEFGLEQKDLIYLKHLITNFNGGPVGLDSIAIAINEAPITITDVYEPYLLKEGFIKYTPKGRIAQPRAYQLFRKEYNG